MEKGIVIAGSGGQGILFLGRLIAHSAMLSGMEVTWFPSYGAEMRGGTANCTVVISDEMVGSPVISKIDYLIVFNEQSFKKFFPRLKDEGMVFLDSTNMKDEIMKDKRIICVPSIGLSASTGNPKLANMVMLGAFLKKTGIVSIESVIDALNEITSVSRRSTINTNIELIRKGMDFIGEDKKSGCL